MKPERWRQIDDLLQAVIQCPLSERETRLDNACSGDKTLRQAVESLLSFCEEAETFLERPALEDAAELFWEGEAELMSGQLIGAYRIEARLGSGGMGEVYLAEDTKLDRKVAIKFLPPYLEHDGLAKRRLIREAKAAAKLDHPNICTVYGVKEEADRSFIEMQYVAGETLADRLKNHNLDLREALDICIDVVEALVEAHSRGIIHRDIKPGNIMITAQRQVKVLDFGLAKFVGPGGAEERDSRHQGILSRSGERPGTPPYMSPEQVKGLPLDARSDLFAAGVILYECLTGERPFSGKTYNEIFSQVIKFDPPQPSKLKSDVPTALDGIVIKALAKEPDARYQSASDLLEDLLVVRNRLHAQHDSRVRKLTTVSMVICLALLAYFVVLPRLRGYRAPAEAVYWYDKGTRALRNGAYYEASKAFQQAIGVDNTFALAHARLAEAYSELDYTDKAKDEIIRAESLSHDLPLQPTDALYLKALSHTVLRDFSPAIQTYQKIARDAPDQEKANVHLDLGRAYEKYDDLARAKENYQEAARMAPQEASAFLRLGVVCGLQQNFSCAADAFQKSESLYQSLNNLEGVTEVFYQRGLLFIFQIKPPEARVAFEKALDLTKTTGNRFQLIRVLLALSRISELEGHMAQAQQQATEAIQLARDNGIENQATSGLVWLGNTFLLRGDYSNAEKYYQQALQLAQRDKMLFTEAWALTQLGSLRSLQHQTEEALRYVEKPFAFYKERGYRKMLTGILTLRGRADRDKGNYEAALNAFTELRQLGEQLSDQAQVGLASLDIGNVLSYQEQYSEALRHFDESYTIFKSLKVDVYTAYAAQSRASVLWQLGHSEAAKSALEEAKSLAERAERPKMYKSLLADIHLTYSLLELSDWHLRESRVEGRKARDLAEDGYPALSVQTKHTLALAQARSGAMREVRSLCKDATDMAAGIGDPQLLSGAQLSCSEAMIERDAQYALETALRAQNSFARFGKQDSEWRAWLIAAKASQRLGKATATHEYASSAFTGLSKLEQKWGSEDYKGYLQRSDIERFRNQLYQILKH